MNIREQFLSDLEALIRQYDPHADELNDALAILSALGAAVCVEAEETMCELITPLVLAIRLLADASSARLN